MSSPDPESQQPTLRAITYLAPGIPLEFFECVGGYLAQTLGAELELTSEEGSSGPMSGSPDPFADDLADVGFLCSPAYLYLRSLPQPSVELLPAACVFADPRHSGEPVYYSEMVVPVDAPARSFADLQGSTWGYNDETSLSGHFATLQRLRDLGHEEPFFQERRRTGSHHASIAALLDGSIDCAAIDSTTLTRLRKTQPAIAARLRVVDSAGPFPIQPIVVRAGLPAERKRAIAAALLDWRPGHPLLPSGECLKSFGLERFVPIAPEAYDEERSALCALGAIPTPKPQQGIPPCGS